jgi:hypothetical protein
MNLSLSELNKVARYRHAGKTFAEIGKLLHRRKSTVLTDWQIFTHEYPRKLQPHVSPFTGKVSIPDGYHWKIDRYSRLEVGSMRRKQYRFWKWQYWIYGRWQDADGDEQVGTSYSFAHATIDEPLMRKEAIANFAPGGGKKGGSGANAWRLVKTYRTGYNLFHIFKNAPVKTPRSRG